MDTSHKTKEEIEEHQDTEEKIISDSKKIAKLIKQSQHCVIYTGAGNQSHSSPQESPPLQKFQTSVDLKVSGLSKETSKKDPSTLIKHFQLTPTTQSKN
jgi:thiamine pyrophosphate-dependent acetolactate synthase large subunit-like protein